MLRTTELMSIFATFHPVIDGPCSGYRVMEFPPQMEMGKLAPGKPISTAECLLWGHESLGFATVLVYETEEQAALAIIDDKAAGTARNPYAGVFGLPDEFPAVFYLMRKPDEQASAAPEPDAKQERFAGVGDLIKSGKIAFDTPPDESEIKPINPEQLRAAVANTEAFMAWKLVGGEGMPPEGFKAEDMRPVEREDPFSNEALMDDLLRYQEALRAILYDVHQQVFDKGERLTKIADIAYAALNPKKQEDDAK